MSQPTVIWIAGPSAVGKTTLAQSLAEIASNKGLLVKHIDGDSLRKGLNEGLGFTTEDRNENLRRAGHVARLFAESGALTICSFITPLEEQRRMVKNILQPFPCYIIGLEASIETLQSRDTKGYYEAAAKGEIQHFTGVQAPFEKFESADLVINTEITTADDTLDILIRFLNKHLELPA